MPISIKKNRQVFDEAGISYTIGDLIFAISNSSKIYGLTGCDGKVYVEAMDIHKNRYAVRRMSDILSEKPGVTEKHIFKNVLWPEKLVKGENDVDFTGFICTDPQFQGDLTSLTEIIAERNAKNSLSKKEREQFLNIGIQLAELIGTIHECKYTIGTLSPDKFWVSENGEVYSCISYQFSFGHLNAFDNPYYVAPEWLSRRNREKIVFNQQSDAFLYAIILFQLLTGKYPFFTERNIAEVEKEELWEQMVDGKSLYFWENSAVIDAIKKELQNLSPDVERLFKRTFDYCGYEEYDETRASIQDWLFALRGDNNF